MLIFTDVSTNGNPGPTGAGVAIYLERYNSAPVLFKKTVPQSSNNYAGWD